ncbi:hypothetical protein GCM10007276_34250 [Agaricicola taiwanensis]|uniref:Uncharacterized protein n=1 Tax=Agaricicola taiwanensis TaxID=591372 RepID=A0A8J3E0F9_9RHOB|nr:hypothetical protein [Agaricicola taiwanensis]GGE54315.1 hypothetical protein GCM10007276_34250 [Agaricicola taiwanensis]
MLSALFASFALLPSLLALAGALALFIYGRTLAAPFRLVATLGALLLFAYAAFGFGSLHERGACAAESLKAELAAARADFEAARRLSAETLKRMAEAESLAALDLERSNELADDLARRPDAACLLDDADARRLREFGQPPRR